MSLVLLRAAVADLGGWRRLRAFARLDLTQVTTIAVAPPSHCRADWRGSTAGFTEAATMGRLHVPKGIAALAASGVFLLSVACGDRAPGASGDPSSTPTPTASTSTGTARPSPSATFPAGGPASPSPTVRAIATATPAPPVTSVPPVASQPTPQASAPPEAKLVTGLAGAGLVLERAPIESLELRIVDAISAQHFVDVSSGLPNGCARFYGYELARAGDIITVTVWNTMPADIRAACTMLYGFAIHAVPLGANLVPGRQYTLHVNDRHTTFIAR